MMKAAIYARYSSHQQSEQSIDGQLRDCRRYAEENGMEIVHEYIDRAISARSDDRPQFLQMIEDSQRHSFEYILVWKLDRFARNRYDSAIYRTQLKKNHVALVSVTERISTEPEGVILEGLLEAMAEYYSLNLAKHVRRGMREGILAGKVMGGRGLYGYDVIEQRFVINSLEADVVRRIFQLYDDGAGVAQIARLLYADDVRARSGRAFDIKDIGRMLDHERYTGKYIYDGEIFEDWCPRIIDQALFDRVQKRRASYKRAPATEGIEEPYLLHGKIFCGHCGAPMVGESGYSRRGNIYRYYACRNHKKNHTCNKKNEKKFNIECAVVEHTLSWLPDHIDQIAQAVADSFGENAAEKKIEHLEKNLKRINSQISRLVDSLSVCPDSARQAIFDKMDDLAIEKRDMEDDLAEARSLAESRITKEMIAAFLRQFQSGDLCDPDFRAYIIEHLVAAVFVYDDDLLIFYHCRDSNEHLIFDPTQFDPASYLPSKIRMRFLQDHQAPLYPNLIILDSGIFGILFRKKED